MERTMEEGATVALGSISTSEKVVDLLNELAKTFPKFFEILFAVIPVATLNTDEGRSLLMMALVFMVVLYFLTLVLRTMLQQLQPMNLLLPILLLINLSQACAVSVLALTMISTPIAWVALVLWIFIIGFEGYCTRQELYQIIPKRIKDLIEGGIMSTRNSEVPRTEFESGAGDIENPQYLISLYTLEARHQEILTPHLNPKP